MYFLLVAVVLLLSSVVYHRGETACYCIKPEGESCTNNPCHDSASCQYLTYYVNSSSQTEHLLNGSTFHFLSGDHTLDDIWNFTNGKLQNMALVGSTCNSSRDSLQTEATAIIECDHNQTTGVHFQNVTNLTITGLSFTNCGFIGHTPHETVASALLMQDVRDLSISGAEIHQSRGWGLFCYSVLGDSTIDKTIISGGHHTVIGAKSYSGGNLRLKFYHHYDDGHHHFNVANSKIINGTENVKNASAYAGGIDIYLITSNKIDVLLNNVLLVNNRGYDGGHVAITYSTLHNGWNSSVTISNCQFEQGHAHLGAGIYMELIMKPEMSDATVSNGSNNALHVVNTHFINNIARMVGAAVFMQTHEHHLLTATASVTFRNCTFTNNTGHLMHRGRGGSAVNIVNYNLPGFIPHHMPQYKVVFENCTFSRNSILNKSNDSIGCGTLYVEENAQTVLENVSISNNKCSAIAAVHTSLVLKGNITIVKNSDYNGGGIVLCANSIMYLSPDVNVTIERNHAHNYGGGIYAEFECSEVVPPCIYQFNYTENITSPLVHLTKNTAKNAGSAVYGGSIDFCFLFLFDKDTVNQSSRFNKLFKFVPLGKTSMISSNPYRVCFCHLGVHHPCNSTHINPCNSTYNYSKPIYAGSTITVRAVVVGQRNGTAPGVVVAKLKHRDGVHHELGHLQDSQIVKSKQITKLKYTISTNIGKGCEKIMLSVENADSRDVTEDERVQSSINVTIKMCPDGFHLSNRNICDCLPRLKEYLTNITCDIQNVTIKRDGNTNWWLGYKNYSDFCPFDFCTTNTVYIQVTKNMTCNKEYDKQCAFSRTGVLCGECPPGLSIVFGSAKCKDCSNSIATLVLLTSLFTLLGVLLVLLLGFFDLNVTEGTLNAIIFYMNIVSINNSLLFHSDEHLHSQERRVKHLLNIFVAWMNLDFGIEICYFHRMTAICKTALQFVFPLYLWILSGLIIFLSRRSSLIARMAGKNSVRLLATIILFSYAKILRCIIDIFWTTTIYNVHGNNSFSVWIMDGNIRYFHKSHTILFAVAVVATCATLPYTLALLCIQCLRKIPNFKLLFWVVKWKPFFDAYTGPYRDRYHFWTGFLLIVRIALFVAIATNTTKGPILNLTLINVTAAILFLYVCLCRIYKTWQLTAIEAFTYFNLVVFTMGTAYEQTLHYHKFVTVLLCIGSMFLLFSGIVVYNVYKKIASTNSWGRLKVWLLEQEWPWVKRKQIRSLILPHADDSSSSEDELDPVLYNAPPVKQYDQYREPLIETNS